MCAQQCDIDLSCSYSGEWYFLYRFFTTKDENVINSFLNIIKVSEKLDMYIIISLK